MSDIEVTPDGLLKFLEELTQTFTIAIVFLYIFHFISWPFISISRVFYFVISFGKINPTYKQSFNHPFVGFTAVILGFGFMLWFLVVVVPLLYAN